MRPRQPRHDHDRSAVVLATAVAVRRPLLPQLRLLRSMRHPSPPRRRQKTLRPLHLGTRRRQSRRCHGGGEAETATAEEEEEEELVVI